MYGFDELRVVTPARWLADDLRAGARGLRVVHDLGLDVPSDVTRTAWWSGHGFVARLRATPGVCPPALASPGPSWLTTVPAPLLGRTVWCGTLDSAPSWSGPAFAKPAEIKVASLPAQAWRSTEQFVAVAASAGLASRSAVILSDPIDFVSEVRAFVLDGRVAAACVYLDRGQTWDAWEADERAVPEGALRVAATVAGATAAPRGWVVDVGQATDGRWLVIEANAAWSSSPYHCDPEGVVASVLASQAPGQERWAWTSDPMLDARARALTVNP